jgi:putative aldouronate transport system permease protein
MISMPIQNNRSSRLGAVTAPVEALFHVVIGLFSLFCIIPFIFVIIISFSSEHSIQTIGFSFAPMQWATEGYRYVFAVGEQLWRSYFNSIYVSVLGTAVSMLVTAMYAYAMFRRDFKYRKFFTFFSFFTMIFAGGLAPTYVVSKQLLGLHNNYAALIVPLLVSPFNFIIMRTFFKSFVPEALIEAATIDGSSEYRTLFQIILPISLPGIATVSLLTLIQYWNDWYSALLYLDSNDKHIPLQFLLWRMQSTVDFLAQNASRLPPGLSQNAADLPQQSLRMALVVLIVFPIACAYPFFQRYIIAGLTVGAVKE